MPTQDKPASAHDKRVRDVIEGISNGSIGRPDRKLIRDAVDKADAPPVGRAAQDIGLGRAVGGKQT